MVRANRRNATASRSIANDASAAAVDAPDTPATVDAFASSSSADADTGEHLDDFLLSLGSSPLGSPDTNAIVGETPNDADVNEANDCDDTIVNDKEEDVDDCEFLPNAAVNDDTMNVDAPSNDANEEEGEDTNGEENTALDAHDDTPTDDSGEPPADLWDLKKIYTTKDILKSNAVKCMGDKCRLVACSIWSSNLNPEEPWFSCLDCQENDFNGWPEDNLPVHLDDEWRNMVRDKCTADDDPVMPNVPRVPGGEPTTACPSMSSDANGDATDEEEEEGVGGMWELTKIYTLNELKKSKPIMCSNEDCGLVACSRWESTEGGKPWNSCLDCQAADYKGWPGRDEQELPVDHITKEHRRLIVEKCSNPEENPNPAMPDLPLVPGLLSTAGKKSKGCAITPPPSHNRAVTENQSNVVVGMAGGGKKGGKKKDGDVTPSPLSKGAPKKTVAAGSDKPKEMSKNSLELHKKWQAEAEKLGGPGVKIIVGKSEAKKLIFDKLHDAFAPMNIDGISKMLKSIVPSIILRSCLDDMVDQHNSNPFAEDSDDDNDDDDDEGKPKKKKKQTATKKSTNSSDEFAGSLRLKEGRNVQNSLYYVDHSKLANEGNGLPPEVKNDLICESQKSKAELDHFGRQLKSITAEASQLESEPKNEALIVELANLEKTLEEMTEKITQLRSHAVNEKHVQKVRKEIDNMSAVWRKRKRLCYEFITNMEESTEGTISLKKCLKGEGALEIDSDEAAIKGATTFGQRKRPKFGKSAGGENNRVTTVRADDRFIGVKLSAQGRPERVFL